MPPKSEDKLFTWPNWPLKLRTSLSHEEGAERDFAVVTNSFEGENGRVTALNCLRVDAKMKPIEGSGAAAYATVSLSFAAVPTKEQITADLLSKTFAVRARAERYRKMLAGREDDSIHVSDGASRLIPEQIATAQRIQVVEKWGKSLTAVVVVAGLVLAAVYFYGVWQTGAGNAIVK